MRMTIPKSQGKQPFYDARKSSWGDIFPHEPKNAPQERYQPSRSHRKGGGATKGADIGKRQSKQTKERVTYEGIAENLKEKRKKSRREHTGQRKRFDEYDDGPVPEQW